MHRKLILLFISLSVLAPYSCEKDHTEPVPEDNELIAPAELQVTVNQENNTATITGKADANVEVSLKYSGTRGELLKKERSNGQGAFEFTIDLLPGYEQEFVVFTSRVNTAAETSKEVPLTTIPAKEKPPGLTLDEIRQRLTSVRWKSDQNRSRMLIRQTAPTPPYDMFVLVAQKYFDFKADGKFHFTVTSPLQFTDTNGNWTMDGQGIININTTIPLGPMQIRNARINTLDDSTCSLLADISDGIFLLSFTKDE
jgi:hypothetical protein